MDRELNDSALVVHVQKYIERMRAGDQIGVGGYIYASRDLNESGVWEIVGELTEPRQSGRRFVLAQPLVAGRFVDAIAYAVQNSAFYGKDEKGQDVFPDVAHPNNGYIKKTGEILAGRSCLDDLVTVILPYNGGGL